MTNLTNCQSYEHPIRRTAWAIGVVLLVFGNFLPGSQHWPIAGLALIVFSFLF